MLVGRLVGVLVVVVELLELRAELGGVADDGEDGGEELSRVDALEVLALAGRVRLAAEQDVLLLGLGGVLLDEAGVVGVGRAAGALGDGAAGLAGAAAGVAVVAGVRTWRGASVGGGRPGAALAGPRGTVLVEVLAAVALGASVHGGESGGVCSG